MFGIVSDLGFSRWSTFSCIFPSTFVRAALPVKFFVAKLCPSTVFPLMLDWCVPKSFCHQLTFFSVGGAKALASKCSSIIWLVLAGNSFVSNRLVSNSLVWNVLVVKVFVSNIFPSKPDFL